MSLRFLLPCRTAVRTSLAYLILVSLLSLAAVAQPAGDPAAPTPAADTSRPTLFIIGDSTASNSADLGWGSHLGKYFDPDRIHVVNRARGGRSSRTFRSEGLWAEVLEQLKPGDFVLIQFGHNDGGMPGVPPDRGSLPGLGEETRDITNLRGEEETVHTFGWYMRQYVREAREKGATPIVLSLTVRNEWRGGRVERGPGRMSAWSRAVAESENALFVDANNIIGELYERLGQEIVAGFFPIDHTHTSADGANVNARCVVAGLRGLAENPLEPYLNELGRAIPPARLEALEATQATARPYRALLPADDDPPLPPPAEGPRPPRPTPGTLHDGFDPELPTVWLVGDSTVRNARDDGIDGLWGWGNPIRHFFDTSRINVENQALGGTSSRTFRTAGFWNNVLQHVKPGDFVVIQFGHNDGGGPLEGEGARRSLPGIGDETAEAAMPGGVTETVHTYGWYLKQYVADVRERGATPIICSLVPRNMWADGHVVRTPNDFRDWAAQAARETGADYIDLYGIIAQQYDALGQDAVRALFPSDHTHTGWEGAVLNAKAVVAGLNALDTPLKDYLTGKGRAIMLEP